MNLRKNVAHRLSYSLFFPEVNVSWYTFLADADFFQVPNNSMVATTRTRRVCEGGVEFEESQGPGGRI